MSSPALIAPEAPAWPPVVMGVLHIRRRRVGNQARGRVLDLGRFGPPLASYAQARPTLDESSTGRPPAGAHDGVESVTVVEPDPDRADRLATRATQVGLDLSVAASVEQAADRGPFDTVISVLALAERADLPAALGAAIAAMHPSGSLVIIEPSRAPGVTPALTAPLVALRRDVRSLHLNRDVPSAVRAHGLTIATIERFTMPTLIWPLRPFVHATARQIDVPAGGVREDGGS